jgi:hypothetical protein
MNNFANIDISAKSLYDVSLGTQRKGLMEKNETKNSHATIPLKCKLCVTYLYRVHIDVHIYIGQIFIKKRQK